MGKLPDWSPENPDFTPWEDEEEYEDDEDED